MTLVTDCAPDPEPPVVSRPANSSEVRAVGAITLVAGGVIAAVFAVLAYTTQQGLIVNGFLIGFALLFVWPHGVVLYRLARHRHRLALRLGIQIGRAVSVVGGLMLVLLGASLVANFSSERLTWEHFSVASPWLALSIVHSFLWSRASRMHRALWPEERASYWGGTAGMTAYCTVVLLIFAAFLPSLLHNRNLASQVASVGSLRVIYVTAVQYRDTYQNGFPRELAHLGPDPGGNPSCWRADLVDSLIAGGSKSGYIYAYTPGPPVEEPLAGCPVGVKSFVVTARPRVFGETGRRNYFMDETGVVRGTPEDRAANAKDPPIS